MPINIKDSIESSTIKGSLNGNASTATKATQDSAGQQINKTYIKGLSVSGKTITYTKGDGTTGTITTQDTNTTYSTGTASALGLTKLYTGTGTATDGTMTQNAINTALNGKANSSHGRHIPDACASITDWNSATTNGWYMGVNATNAPTSGSNVWYFGEVVAHDTNYVIQTVYQFTASTDAKAIPKYIRAKTNGTWGAWTNVTVAKAVPSNAVFTDTNTWRGVQDNLTSTAKDQSLSANQGKVLKGLIDGKAASNHTHSYVPLANGGNITIHADSDSSSTGEYALIKAGHNELKIASSAGGTTVTKGQDKLTFNGNIVYHAGRKPTISEIGAAAASHTHNYAGSSSAGGNANAAVKLATARTINGTNFDGSANITTANWGTARTITVGNTGKSVNGNGNVSWSLSEIGALPLTGGTLSGRLTANGRISAPTSGSSWINGMTITNATIGISTQQATDSYHPVLAVKTSGNHVANIGGIGDDFGFYGFKSGRKENGIDWSFKINVGTGAVSSTGNITAPTFVGALSGNATTATTLQTARTINGTSFNGSANITTANWGTARNIYIASSDGSGASSAVSVNGSGNATLKLPATIKATLSGNASTATTSNYLASNTRMDYGWNGINYFNIEGKAGKAAKANDTPTSAWWHVMRFNHGNSNGFYTDLAIPFNDVSMYYKRITNGAVNNGGWVKMLDALNYNNYAPTKTGGGASGTWGISVSGNAATATKATQDSAGQQINKTYIKGLSVSGKTITYTKGDGTTGTITTQDTNTTYSVGTASALGLTKLYTGTGTNTDGTMTQSAINSALSGKVNKTGDTMTGSLTVNNNLTVNGSGKTISITVPNTSYAWISTNTSSGLYSDQNLSVKGEIYAGANYNNRVYHTGFKPTPAEIGAAASSHSHQSLATANDNGSFSQNYSGFKRPNNHAIGNLAIHCTHPENNNGGYSRGISFNYGDNLALWTYAFSPDGTKHTKTRIYTEDYKPHTYGTGAPNNSDGRPDGSIYYRYA